MLAPERGATPPLGALDGAALAAEAWTDDTPLEACYRACREIARRHAKTFYLSSLFLTPEKRRAVWAVYAFCRTADDIVDRIAPERERLDAIDAWQHRLNEAYDGCPSGPVFVALADAAARYDIPIEPALDLLRGARTDVTVRHYETYEELRDYCYLVASTVGLLVLPILGTVSPQAARYGVALGRAMQMTNILRDVGEDARMGRIYLPREDLRRFGCDDATIVEARLDEGLRALMQFEVERVRAMYAEAEPGIALLAPESRYTVRLALSLYRDILARIESNGYDVFSRRAYVPRAAKMRAAVALLFAR